MSIAHRTPRGASPARRPGLPNRGDAMSVAYRTARGASSLRADLAFQTEVTP